MSIDIIKKHEGLRLEAYPDPATGGEPWTIGYGNTFYEDGSKVKNGDVISMQRADTLLKFVVGIFQRRMQPLISAKITDNQLWALTSFAYNVGIGNFQKSTLLKKVNANPSDPTIADEFLKWNKAAGKVMAGLTKRRKEESILYFTV